MKTFKYKITSLLILLCIGLQAQNFDKKVKETFKVNSEVSIDINSSHTDIDIETWNKNEVSIEGFMEVSGVSKEERLGVGPSDTIIRVQRRAFRAQIKQECTCFWVRVSIFRAAAAWYDITLG